MAKSGEEIKQEILKNLLSIDENNPNSLFGGFSMPKEKRPTFEILTSSLSRNRKEGTSKYVSLDEAKEFSKNDIVNNLTPVHDLDFGTYETNSPFKFLARVDTSGKGKYNINDFAQQILDRNYLSYTVITDENISHYKTNCPFMLVYDMPAKAIVHVFPYDSDTNIMAENEEDVSGMPSTWLSMDELCKLTNEIGKYNQITCKTMIDDNPIFPKAVLCFDEKNKKAEAIAKKFKLPIIVCHPKENAISYVGDSMDLIDKDNNEAYFKMIEIFKREFRKCFSSRKEKEVFDSFIESMQPDIVEMLLNNPFEF